MKKYNCIIGIDPGANGGIAVYENGRVRVAKMSKDLKKLEQFVGFYNDTYNTIVFIEKLQIRQDDLTGGKVFRIKSLIANYEALKAVISIASCDYVEVHPLTWQSKLNLRKKGEQYHERKNRFKETAQKFYQNVNVTLANCDALLIMRYGMEMLHSTQKKDIKWIADNIVVNNNNDEIYNYIY